MERQRIQRVWQIKNATNSRHQQLWVSKSFQEDTRQQLAFNTGDWQNYITCHTIPTTGIPDHIVRASNYYSLLKSYSFHQRRVIYRVTICQSQCITLNKNHRNTTVLYSINKSIEFFWKFKQRPSAVIAKLLQFTNIYKMKMKSDPINLISQLSKCRKIDNCQLAYSIVV